MATRFIPFLITCVAAIPAAAITEPRDPQPAALEKFSLAVHQYAAQRLQIEQDLPPRKTDNAARVFESSDALAAAVQAARTRAREGDVFTREVAEYFRDRIAESLTANGFLPEELLASNIDQADEGAPAAVVNGRFPWGRGALMWPCVLDVLPRLPNELQYRFVGRDLVLLDTRADLVVDILRDAVR